MMTTVHRKK